MTGYTSSEALNRNANIVARGSYIFKAVAVKICKSMGHEISLEFNEEVRILLVPQKNCDKNLQSFV